MRLTIKQLEKEYPEFEIRKRDHGQSHSRYDIVHKPSGKQNACTGVKTLESARRVIKEFPAPPYWPRPEEKDLLCIRALDQSGYKLSPRVVRREDHGNITYLTIVVYKEQADKLLHEYKDAVSWTSHGVNLDELEAESR
jgi:hypothetical protein